MESRYRRSKLRRLRIYLKDKYAFTIEDMMKILKLSRNTAAMYRNMLMDEGFIDVSHGVRRKVFYKVIRKENGNQRTTTTV